MTRAKKSRPLGRRVATRTPHKTFVVFCEGQRTEPEYLEALKREPAVKEVAAVDIQVRRMKNGAVPQQLVRLACKARQKAEDEEGEIDEVWCVFDVEWPENHPRLREAIAEAHQNGIHVAVSKPCFELWLILHFTDQTRWLETAEASRLRAKLDRSTGKGLDAARYMPQREQAAQRAGNWTTCTGGTTRLRRTTIPRRACTGCSPR